MKTDFCFLPQILFISILETDLFIVLGSKHLESSSPWRQELGGEGLGGRKGAVKVSYNLGFILFLKFIIYFWLRWVFVAVRWLSLAAASGGYSSLWCAGFSLQWLLLLRSTGSRCTGFSSCGTQAQ